MNHSIQAMNQDLSIVTLLLHASFVVQLVVLLLVGISIASWAAIFRKFFALKRMRALNDEFEREFWSGTSLNELFSAAAQNAKLSGPMERIFASGMREYQKLRERHVEEADVHVALRVDARQLGADHLGVTVAVLVDADEVLARPVPREAERPAHRERAHPLVEDAVHPVEPAGGVRAAVPPNQAAHVPCPSLGVCLPCTSDGAAQRGERAGSFDPRAAAGRPRTGRTVVRRSMMGPWPGTCT